MKRYIYGIPLLLLAVLCVYYEIFWLGGLVGGFWIGFLVAVDIMYKKATGKKLNNETLTEVLEELLP